MRHLLGGAPLTELAQSAGALLQLAPGGGFVCERLELLDEHTLSVRFEADGGDFLEVLVGPADAPPPVFKRLPRCSVRYTGRLSRPTEGRRQEVLAVVHDVAAGIDARLAEHGGTLAEALGRRGSGRRVFGRDTLRALLAPEIVEGRPTVDGWTLEAVYPSSHLQEQADAALTLVLELRRDSEAPLRLIVGPRVPAARSFASTTHLSVHYYTAGAPLPAGAARVCSLVSFLLSLRDHPGAPMTFPDLLSDVGAHALPAPEAERAPDLDDESAVLNLSITADCGQDCAFCSVRELVPPAAATDMQLARLFADLESNRARGVRRVRLNGYDPLAHPRVLDVGRRARDLGYTHADVFSPCTRLADAGFCDALLDALPPSRTFHVPLYAVEPAVHDAVTGVVGSHAAATRAIDLLEARAGLGSVAVLAVVTERNVEHVPALCRWARGRGIPFGAHTPFPSSESPSDRFFEVAPTQRRVAEVLAAAYVDEGPAVDRLYVAGVAPCVTFDAMTAAGVAPRRWMPVDPRQRALPGTEYRDDRYRHRAAEAGHGAFTAPSLPCPHAARCALSTVCSREVLRAYVDRHGVDELRAVSLGELLDAAGAGGA